MSADCKSKLLCILVVQSSLSPRRGCDKSTNLKQLIYENINILIEIEFNKEPVQRSLTLGSINPSGILLRSI